MRHKLVIAILTSFFLTLAMTGCQPQDQMLMDDASHIKQISISESNSFGKLNDEFFITISESQELDPIKHAFLNAKREKRKLDEVHYDLLVTDKDGGHYLLQCYLGEEGEPSAFFYIGHEDKVYFTSPEVTEQLRKIIKR